MQLWGDKDTHKRSLNSAFSRRNASSMRSCVGYRGSLYADVDAPLVGAETPPLGATLPPLAC
jgi:hypothetical protein